MSEQASVARASAPGAQEKPRGYYANARPDLVRELPRPLGRVLDVGCGEGEVGRLLLAEGALSVTGIELNERVAHELSRREGKLARLLYVDREDAGLEM